MTHLFRTTQSTLWGQPSLATVCSCGFTLHTLVQSPVSIHLHNEAAEMHSARVA